MQLDWSSKDNVELKQLIAEAETENFGHEFKNQLYVMVEKMAQDGLIKQGKAEPANIGVVDLLIQISSITNQDKTAGSKTKLLDIFIEELKSYNFNIGVPTKLIICLVCKQFDKLTGFFEKSFFENLTDMELINHIAGTDWTFERKNELIQLVAVDKAENSEYDIESKVYYMIKMMAKDKVIRSGSSPDIDGPRLEVKAFHSSCSQFVFKVRNNATVNDVISQLQKQRDAEKRWSGCVENLFFDDRIIEGTIEKYNFKNGDNIYYNGDYVSCYGWG